MATERTTDGGDGPVRERVIERDVGGGPGVGGVILGVAVLALVAIIAFFLLNQSRNDNMRTDAVTGAASSVAHSTDSAAKSVGDAAQRASGSPQQ